MSKFIFFSTLFGLLLIQSGCEVFAEKEIINEIKNLKGNVTMIVIAHRTTTIEHCDVIYKLSKGNIVASGPPKEIL